MRAVAAVDDEMGARQVQLAKLIEKIMPIARASDAIATRTVAKVGVVALFGSLAAAWLAIACALTWNWGLATSSFMFVPLLIPSLVLWKIHGTLRSTIGLPHRLVATSDRLLGKLDEYRQTYAARQTSPMPSGRPRFRDLWHAARELFELKTLGDEGRELWSTMAGAVVMATPIFAITMFITVALCVVLSGVAGIVALAFVL